MKRKKLPLRKRMPKIKKRKKNSERNIENPLKPAPDIVYNRIKSFFIGSGKELKGVSRKMTQNYEAEIDSKSKRTKRKRTKKSKRNIFLTVAVSVLPYMLLRCLLVSRFKSVAKKRRIGFYDTRAASTKHEKQRDKKSLDANINDNSEYIERLARTGLDFVKPGERVFVNVAGN